MKVFIILDNFSDNEASRLILNEEREFRRRNIDIMILTLHTEEMKTTLYRNLAYPERDFKSLLVKNIFDLYGWRRLVKFLREEKPDLVMTHLKNGNRIGRLAAFIARVPKIISFEEGEKVSSLNQILQYCSDKIIATSDAQALLLESYDIKKRKIAVLHNSINPSLYKKGAPQDIRRELSIAPGAFLFLYFGMLTKESGVDVLLRAFSKLKNGTLIIMGDGPERKELEALSKHLLLTGRTSFFPAPKNMLQMLATSDCLVIPSREEGPTDIIIDALASGLPLIVTDFPSYRELVTDGQNGLVVKSQDSEDLSRAMQFAVGDATLMQKLRANTALGLEKYSPITHAEKILELVQEPGSVVYRFWRFLWFLAVAGVSFVIQLAMTYALTEFFPMPYLESASIAFGVAMLVCFAEMKFKVFQDVPKKKMLWQFPGFLMEIVVLAAVNAGMLYLLVEYLGIWYLMAQAIILVFLILPEFWMFRILFQE